MPRKSSDARVAAAFRAETRPLPPPPARLDAESAAVWREIVADRPAGWFTPAALRLLARFVRTVTLADRLHNALDELDDIAGPEAAKLQRRIVAATGSAASVGTKLRLLPQSQITRGSAVLTAPAPLRDPLLGGAVVGIRDR